MSIRALQVELTAHHNQLLWFCSNGQPLEMSQLAQIGLGPFGTVDMENLERAHIQQLQKDYGVIWQEAVNHFESLKHIENEAHISPWEHSQKDRMAFATPQEQATAHTIRRSLTEFGARLLQAVRSSALLESTDEVLVRRR